MTDRAAPWPIRRPKATPIAAATKVAITKAVVNTGFLHSDGETRDARFPGEASRVPDTTTARLWRAVLCVGVAAYGGPGQVVPGFAIEPSRLQVAPTRAGYRPAEPSRPGR